MIRCVVFDLDGTLVDSRADIVDAVTFTLREAGGPPRTAREIASYVGDGARMLLARAFDLPATDARLDAALDVFLAYYGRHGADQTTLMPGASQALSSLASIRLAICTNKPRVMTELVIGRLGLDGRFDVVVAGGDLPERKPHPLPLLHIAERLSLIPRDLVMVGDGPQDIACGRAAGTRTIAVSGGFSDDATLSAANPDVLIGSLAELADTIAGFS
jgi:phosphoglycolate phosphatase